LPPALARRFAVEPRWIDVRAYRDYADKAGANKSDAKFTGAKFTELAADLAAAFTASRKRMSEALAEFIRAHDMLTAVVATAPAEVRWKRNLTSLEEQIARLQEQARAR
jgi:hypothetical protein